ncbi:co-regulatory protein PtrA N-terminal domain-containing protein, partial [Pseudomonas gessardii]|uniref:co-regulatory protein PtrA N-terminal domain-containing protein n=1 Tax=Pseudomonas gessardii TaxID=78544 RepID=UPI0039B10A8D
MNTVKCSSDSPERKTLRSRTPFLSRSCPMSYLKTVFLAGSILLSASAWAEGGGDR